MRIRVVLGMMAYRAVRFILRVTGRGGTTLPGKIGVKICPDLLKYVAADVKTVVVTGTNGKTTTSRMIEKTFIDSGVSYLANRSGANLLFGIVGEFAGRSNLMGRCKCEYALIESDEAALKYVAEAIDPECIVVTNVFRDQLDRFGEITHTLENIRIGIDKAPNPTVCLNGDCSMTASLENEIDKEVILFGVDAPIYATRVKEASDAPYCIKCKSAYEYEFVTFGHLGKFSCPECGYSRKPLDIRVSKVIASNVEGNTVEIDAYGRRYRTDINLPGGYNIYNGVAAVSAAYAMGFPMERAIEGLASFEAGFGRMEKFDLNGTETRMVLIKNPAGCNQVLNFLTTIEEKSIFVVMLNDNYADGTDISWIWDVDFEILGSLEDKLDRILVSGIRGMDMALRFKYAGIQQDKISVIENYEDLLDAIACEGRPVYIMPTYTAMMDLRKLISDKYGYKDFWE